MILQRPHGYLHDVKLAQRVLFLILIHLLELGGVLLPEHPPKGIIDTRRYGAIIGEEFAGEPVTLLIVHFNVKIINRSQHID